MGLGSVFGIWLSRRLLIKPSIVFLARARPRCSLVQVLHHEANGHPLRLGQRLARLLEGLEGSQLFVFTSHSLCRLKRGPVGLRAARVVRTSTIGPLRYSRRQEGVLVCVCAATATQLPQLLSDLLLELPLSAQLPLKLLHGQQLLHRRKHAARQLRCSSVHAPYRSSCSSTGCHRTAIQRRRVGGGRPRPGGEQGLFNDLLFSKMLLPEAAHRPHHGGRGGGAGRAATRVLLAMDLVLALRSPSSPGARRRRRRRGARP